ncbi:ribonuclease P protein component [Chloroflexota bacterium]
MRKKYRLRASTDFERVRRKGRTLLHPLLVISTLPNGLEHNRFGFAVGRRLGRAVKRNRIKRRMREVVRLRMQRDDIAGGWDVVLIARRPIVGATFEQIEEAIGLLLRRAGMLNGMP